MNDAVLYESTDDGVASITLNRPSTRNAINTALLEGLGECLRRAGDDAAVRAIVITGAGKGFCAGADLSELAALPEPEQVYDYILRHYQPVIGQICTIQKPVIAAINGVAAGAGASLALACDLRIMADDAALMQAFTNIGLVPDAGSTWFLTRLVGYSRAFEIAAEGERIGAPRCLELGLANRVVEAGSLGHEARQWAQRLAQRPTLALGLLKTALHQAQRLDLMDAIEYEARLQQRAVASEDHREGLAAFKEKRAPRFKGR
jgi:2-(1,2-epoxy-1,2-dihydrophenyl)acetyl-CoA isomerase